MKIFGTGLNGLVGSRIIELLKNHQFEISNIDITDRDAITRGIAQSDASIVLHLAAKTDVDGCEKDRAEDLQEEFRNSKTAWAINVLGTKNIADACFRANKKLIYISTDFVFDGKNVYEEGYKENDLANPVNWYGKTKYEGEKIVQSSGVSYVIARIAYPYRSDFKRNDFVRAILERLKLGQSVKGITDHIMTPTFVDDIALGLDTLIKNNAAGIYHLTGSQFITPYDAAVSIAEAFNLDKSLITKITLEEYFKTRAPRPHNLSMNNKKILELGIKMKGFKEGLEEIKRQIMIQ